MKNIVNKEIWKTPKTSILTIILLLTIVISFIGALKQNNWAFMITALVISILMILPRIVGKLSNITIPIKLEVFTIIFIYCTLFLGELKHYYYKYWWWDSLLHISSGIAFGILGFLILYILYKSERIKTSPKIVATFAFTFALAIGALWEIVEFAIDQGSGFTNMQRGSLVDTMKDLINDAIGGLFSATLTYLYLKKESGLVKPIAKEFKKNNKWLFKRKGKK